MGTCYYSVEVMACPLFLPASQLAPLEDLYGGECAAQAGALIPVVIPDAVLRRCCNAGYARGICERAALSDADAFRFLVKANCAGVVEVAWSSERNHHPVAVGSLAVDCRIDATEAEPLERQAHAYAAAYLRQLGN
jgi:hypothetical protein